MYSDIDLRWHIPGGDPYRCLPLLREALAGVDEVESIRLDPDYLDSSTTRIVFVRFASWPLFWRVDLEVSSMPWLQWQ